jgi:hypothetical protein
MTNFANEYGSQSSISHSIEITTSTRMKRRKNRVWIRRAEGCSQLEVICSSYQQEKPIALSNEIQEFLRANNDELKKDLETGGG